MKLKLWAGLSLVFVVGLLAGSLGTGYYFKQKIERFSRYGPMARKPILIRRLARELDLSQQQRKEIEQIFEQYQIKIDEIRAAFLPEVHELSEQMIQNMKQKLNSDQINRIEEIQKRISRWGPHMRGRPFILPPGPDKMVPEIRKHLHLTNEQEARVLSIMEQSAKEINKLIEKRPGYNKRERRQIRREMIALYRAMNERLETILTKEQMEQYLEIEEHLRREMHHSSGPLRWNEDFR